MDDLVITALKEGRIDRGKGLHAIGSKAGRKGHRMLFGNANIISAARKRLAKHIQAGARGHRCCNGDDFVICFGQLHQGISKHAGIAGGIGFCLGLFTGDDIKLDHAMIFVIGSLGWQIALALLCDDMNQNWAVFDFLGVFKHVHQGF